MKVVLNLFAAALVGSICLVAPGCGNPNERDFTSEPGSAPADAPQSPEEYLEQNPVDQNSP